MRGKNRAFGRGVSRHWRNFFQLQAGHEHWRWRNAAPAVELPAGTKEFDFRAEGDVEDHLGGAAIELLRELKKRALAEILAVGGTPEGDVEGLLLDLLGDREGAKEGAGNGFGDVERRAVAVRFETRIGRDERKFEGHSGVPFLFQRECSTEKLLRRKTRWEALARIRRRADPSPQKTRLGMTISRIRLLQTPGGTLGPVAHGFSCPCRGLVRVARSAWIGDFVFIGHVWRDECERVGANFHVGDGGGDFRHVAGDATAAG